MLLHRGQRSTTTKFGCLKCVFFLQKIRTNETTYLHSKRLSVSTSHLQILPWGGGGGNHQQSATKVLGSKLRSSISCGCTYCKKYRLTIPKCSTHLSLTEVHNRILLTCASTRAVGWILREDDWHSEEHSFYSNWLSVVEI